MPWTFAARREELEGRDVIGVTCASHRVAVYRIGDEFFATSDACPHLGASLSEGCVVDGFIECPVHGALFDIRTGESDGSMTARPVATLPVSVDDNSIYVDVSRVARAE